MPTRVKIAVKKRTKRRPDLTPDHRKAKMKRRPYIVGFTRKEGPDDRFPKKLRTLLKTGTVEERRRKQGREKIEDHREVEEEGKEEAENKRRRKKPRKKEHDKKRRIRKS